MSLKKRIEYLESRTKNEADGSVIFDEDDPRDMYIKSICVEHGIPFNSRIVELWQRLLVPKARDNHVPKS